MHPATVTRLADHSAENAPSPSPDIEQVEGMPPRGWEPILPQVAIHAASIKRRQAANKHLLARGKKRLKPLNLAVVGEPGSDKTDGIMYLYSKLGFKVAKVDSATLNDIAEIAGPQNLNANIEHGQLEFIRGKLADADVIFLDEIIAIKSHVKPQLKLMLQGYLMLFGHEVKLNCVAIMAAGNLQQHLRFGNATQLDSALADRMLMVAETPELGDMAVDNIDRIIQMNDEWDEEEAAEFNSDNGFELALFKAIESIERSYKSVSVEFAAPITRYVRSLVLQVHGARDPAAASASASTPAAAAASQPTATSTVSPFKFQGRRAQWVRMVVEGAFALCQQYVTGQFCNVPWFGAREFSSHEDLLKSTIWLVVRDCLTYHRLSTPPGEELDVTDLLSKHEIAIATMGSGSVEALIAETSDLAEKIALIVAHPEVAPETKADVLGMSLKESNDVALKLACKALMTTQRFKDELPSLKELVNEMPLPKNETGFKVDCDAIERWLPLQAHAEHAAQASQLEIDIFEIACGDKAKIAELTKLAHGYLSAWGIGRDELPKPPHREWPSHE